MWQPGNISSMLHFLGACSPRHTGFVFIPQDVEQLPQGAIETPYCTCRIKCDGKPVGYFPWR
jgi:hypothetical protein